MKRLLLAALLVGLLACGYFFRGYFFDATETRTARPAAAQLVVADVASENPMPIQVTAIGTVQPIATVQIKSRMDGEIAAVNFEEGQEVKEGDTLFTLDDRAVKAQLEQSEANLERRSRPARTRQIGGHAPIRAGWPGRRVRAEARGYQDQHGGLRGGGPRQPGDAR